MLDLKQTDRMLRKLERFVDIIEPMIFEKVGEPGPVSAFATLERFHCIPEDSLFDPIEKGYKWGEEFGYCWFKTDFVVPDGLGGKDIFIRPHISGYEGTLWVDGVPYGNFSTKIVFTGHGNHYCDLLKKDAKAGEKIAIDLEYYAGHSYKGCHPTENNPLLTYDFSYEGIDICVKNYAIQEFYFDLRTLVQLVKNLPESSFRRASVINELEKVFKEIYQSPDDVDRDEFMAALERAKPYLKKALSVKNGDDAPKAALIGHSHMDTAWLWHVGETVKKCARTYANQLALMDEYPEYKFIQSSSCHSDFLRRKYPDLFARIQQKVKEGRYEPNGGVWVECDCNITSGESMVRQFLWGQRFTRKYFDFTSNCFWLPDTFGYSAAIPQIMKGCCVDYFLTTKIDWNDTNTFPLDTFYWEGIDGTKVFTHFNRTHIWPDAEDLMTYVAGTPSNSHSCIKDKRVTDTRVISYGYGDGGGGPQFEMIEASRRCADLNGCPKSEHKLVGEAMKEIERDAVEPDTYAGELYLELHRGTLTNQHVIKRNNRKAEFALRDLEIFTVTDAVKNNKTADSADIAPLYEKLLVNQFHDILPGTCIPRAHEESRAMTTALITRAREASVQTLRDKDPQGHLLRRHIMTVEKLEIKSNPGATLTAYLLDTSKEMPNMTDRPAVLVIPGGGYYMCSDREAEPIAMAFAVHGYNTFVLRYTVGEGKDFKMPLADAEEALTLIRERAEEWHVIKDKIAAIGFSAGAHLAAALSTLSSTRPNACMLGYPCILSEISSILAFPVPSLEEHVDRNTPPTFIFGSASDKTVPVINSIKYAEALTKNEVPFEMHIFAKGWHGFSLCTPSVCDKPESVIENARASQWVKLCTDWLSDTFALGEM